MQKDIFKCNELELEELNNNQLKRIEGGVPWFLVGLLFGALYYLVEEVL